MNSSHGDTAAFIASEFEAAWNSHDMARMGMLLADDVDWITVAGKHLRGRDETERVHAALHAGPLASTRWMNQELTVAHPVSGLALVHLTWRIEGEHKADGSPREPRPGVFTWLLVLSGGAWRIRAAQGTNVLK